MADALLKVVRILGPWLFSLQLLLLCQIVVVVAVCHSIELGLRHFIL